jgi:hypothetical protein
MFNISPKIIETLFEIYPDPTEADFDEIATKCIVQLQANIATLNSFLFSTRGKKITDKRREITTELIANMLFYAAILIHLNDLPPDAFSMDEDAEENGVVEMVSMFDEAYFHSPLLLGNHLMGICADIGEYMWSDKFNSDEGEPAAETTVAATSKTTEIPEEPGYSNFMTNLLEGMQPDLAEEDDTFFPWDDDNDAEPMLARFLAGLMILANLCDIDLGVCMYNASQQTEI